ncbi:MAG: hypothetical protein R3208_21530 [Ketobacteraceae bacterium]|nr:hypothetical protein [Ketobacteraceae bacterium]
MTSQRKAVIKYLRHYSTLKSPQHLSLPHRIQANGRRQTYQQAVVIPAFDESPGFLERLAQLSVSQRSLVIVVINAPRYATSSAIRNTQQLIQHINQHAGIENVSEGVTFGQLNSGLDLLSLDITAERPRWLKPLQSGVGFARKVGMDTAVSLWQQGHLANPWVLSTDADVCWPADYLACVSAPATEPGAVVLNFRHQRSCTDKSLSAAAALYDMSLRYYVLALRWAGSPWAYHTVGSTLGIHCESYCDVRGFPVREAGEDFYLLNKLAKTATIHCPATPVLALSDRISERVPFGTGPAVKRISEQPDAEQEVLFYHPDIFALLKHWHHCITLLDGGENNLATLTDSLPVPLAEGLQALGLARAITHCQRQASGGAQAAHYLWQWFDGFRTLKLIHWLRERGYPSMSYRSWCEMLRNNRIEWIPCQKDVAREEMAKDPVSLSRYLAVLETNTLPYRGGL